MIDFNQILNTVYIFFGFMGISIALIALLAERREWPLMADLSQVITSDYTVWAVFTILAILLILLIRKKD